MTFPSLAASGTAGTTASSTTHSVALPATVNAGERLLALVASHPASGGSVTWSWPAGWTELLDVNKASFLSFSLGWRVAGAGEGGTSITVTTSASRPVIYKSWSFANAETIYALNEAITYATNGNPPSLNPGIGTRDFLWMALCVLEGVTTLTGYPAGYTSTDNYQGSGAYVDTAKLGWGFKTARAASEDPDAFTSGVAERSGITVGITPCFPRALQSKRRRGSPPLVAM